MTDVTDKNEPTTQEVVTNETGWLIPWPPKSIIVALHRMPTENLNMLVRDLAGTLNGRPDCPLDRYQWVAIPLSRGQGPRDILGSAPKRMLKALPTQALLDTMHTIALIAKDRPDLGDHEGLVDDIAFTLDDM